MARRWSCRATWKTRGQKWVFAHSTLHQLGQRDSRCPRPPGGGGRGSVGKPCWEPGGWAVETVVSSSVSWASGGLREARGCQCCAAGPCILLGRGMRRPLSGGAPQPAAPAAQLRGLSLTLCRLTSLSRAGQHRHTGSQTPPCPTPTAGAPGFCL